MIMWNSQPRPNLPRQGRAIACEVCPAIRAIIPPREGRVRAKRGGGANSCRETRAAMISEEREATPPVALPKSDVSDFGHLIIAEVGQARLRCAPPSPEEGEG